MESAQRAKLDQTVLGMETKMNALSLEVPPRLRVEGIASHRSLFGTMSTEER